MITAAQKAGSWQFTIASLWMLLFVYPLTYAAIGPNSNGGMLGLSSLAVGTAFGWIAFVRQRSNVYLRWFLNMPIAVIVSWATLSDALAQFRSGWWLGF